ncbi:MAG: tRNA lysidine(34) synthetase TilS [Holosporaceae bacterium]|jgi:tRNA(Ile)-lysidine synthase|nr:tRNA lysidine(34) synthetase TilS [Holosporaceae bacterium]
MKDAKTPLPNPIAHKFINDRCSFDFFHTEMNLLIDFYREHYLQNPIESACIAVSGGGDSMALLVMAFEWAVKSNLKISCVTVDHRLRADSAEEAKFVEDFCRSMKIDHVTLHWNRNEDIKPGKLENRAREARYQLISEYCDRNNIPILLVGHTWNDQLETFEMRKNAGSSSIGLAGMSRIRSLSDRVKLFRPLLRFTKSHLEEFLKNRNVAWKIDPMNDQDFFKRVFHRKEIARYNDDEILRISNEIMELGKKRNAVETAAVCFLKRFCKFSENGCAVVEKNRLLSEEKAVQAEIFRRITWNVGGKKYATTITEAICDQILCKKINTIGRCLLKVKKDEIFAFRENRKNRLSELPCVQLDHRIAPEANEASNVFLDKINLFDIFL